MIRGFLLRGGNGVEFWVGVCEFYERMVGELVGEVWVDVLRLFSPYLWAFPVENTPVSACKIIRLFLPMTDYRISPTTMRTFVLFQGIIEKR